MLKNLIIATIIFFTIPLSSSAEALQTTQEENNLKQQVVILQQIISLLQQLQDIDQTTSIPPATLTFSNTQSWEPDLEIALREIRSNEEVLEYFEQLEVAPPPQDASSINSEVAILQSLTQGRTATDVIEINREIFFNTAYFNNTPLEDLVADKPNTQELIFEADIRIASMLLLFKNKFDRVRPSFVDPTLSLAIENPGHPAYPSGHAGQSRMIAYVLSDLDPTTSSQYFADADRVALNREIAGVHYRSDSVAGQQLADDLFEIIEAESWYRNLHKEAKKEW